MGYGFLAFPAAIALGSYVEYRLHRALHEGALRKTWLGKVHRAHHASGEAQPLWREGLDYSLLALMALPLGAALSLLLGWDALAWWAAGSFGWAWFAALWHERSHHHNLPFHATHHATPQGNFGLGTDFWDRWHHTRLP